MLIIKIIIFYNNILTLAIKKNIIRKKYMEIIKISKRWIFNNNNKYKRMFNLKSVILIKF